MKPPELFPGGRALPPHAYVPGRTARHDPAIFAAYHDSVREGMAPDDLAQTAAWRAGWHLIENGFFWEAHEVLEPVWMQLRPGSEEREFVQGIIQLANAALKREMGRPKAVRRLCAMVERHLTACSDRPEVMGLRLAGVRACLDRVGAESNPSG